MKTITIFQKAILAAATALLVTGETLARDGKSFVRINDISMNSYISGNGFGFQHNPSLGLRFGQRVILAGGPQFCSGDWVHTGYQVGAGYLLVREGESYNGCFRLSANLSASRFTNQCLGSKAVEVEKMTAYNMNNDESADFAGLRYAGWEYSAGVGLSYRFAFGLLVRTDAALAVYDTQQLCHYNINTYREDKGVSLRLGAGIGWAFAK